MAITYVHPDYNLVADFWIFPNTPSAVPPDLVGIAVQKYVNSRVTPFSQPQIRFAPGNPPIMDLGDIWECPQGSGRYWKCVAWGVFHEGFVNEFWMEQCVYVDNTGNPKSNWP